MTSSANKLIREYVEDGLYGSAIKLCLGMIERCSPADEFSIFAYLIKADVGISKLDKFKQIHSLSNFSNMHYNNCGGASNPCLNRNEIMRRVLCRNWLLFSDGCVFKHLRSPLCTVGWFMMFSQLRMLGHYTRFTRTLSHEHACNIFYALLF
ncbi:hypothetical protein I3842_11G027000 [Carya illinoinensis]|uniref:Pentatricopeptide repeat-containing protein n=1 Tax=Carya illinoinensis TaxID=32201 RepID=A0A922IYQ3_CARIL|nr:hypothetical protein I3842_11G027000 [Carya illinoinensis]